MVALIASRMAVPPRESSRVSPSSIFLMSEVSGTSSKGSSSKLMTVTSSRGFDAFTAAKSGGFHLLALVPHAAAVIDDQSERDRNVLAPECLKRLLDVVLENFKSGPRQIREQPPILVNDARMKYHQARVGPEGLVLLLCATWRNKRRNRKQRQRRRYIVRFTALSRRRVISQSEKMLSTAAMF